jgi:hypothetical protein
MMTSTPDSAATRDLGAVVAALRRSIAVLSRSETVESAARELNEALDQGDLTRTPVAAGRLNETLDLVKKLVKTADDIDPHVVDGAELDRLWRLAPDALVTEALLLGELRERRLVLQAMEAKTNRRLSSIAIGAAVVALLVPFVERLAQSL